MGEADEAAGMSAYAKQMADSLKAQGLDSASFGRRPTRALQALHPEIISMVEKGVALEYIISVLNEAGVECARTTLRKYLVEVAPDIYGKMYGRSSPKNKHQKKHQKKQDYSKKNATQQKYSKPDVNGDERHPRVDPSDFFGKNSENNLSFLEKKSGE